MRIILGFISIVFSLSLFAQTNVHSEGTKISIQKDALLYISGDLVMNASPNVNEATLVNTGTIRIGGDIENNSPLGVFLDIGRPGPVVFMGTGNQHISGLNSYIPSIFLEKTSDSLIIEQAILRVDSTIRFNPGNLGHIMVGENKIIMETNGFIVGERETNRLVLDGGSVEIEMPTLENIADTIIYITNDGTLTGTNPGNDSIFFQTSSDFDIGNLFGLGWGTAGPESAQGENGGTGVQIWRESTYTPVPGQTQVANGVTADRLYRMNFYQKDDSLDGVILHYFPEDLVDVPSPRALYVSNDNGISWSKMEGGVFATNDSTITFTVENIPIQPILTSPDPANASNLFVVAEANCNPSNLPSTDGNRFFSTAPIDDTNPIYEVNLCLGEFFELSYAESQGTVFDWEFRSLLADPSLPLDLSKIRNDTISIGTVSVDDIGIYRLRARNTKGCETFRDLRVNVWSPPQWNGVEPNFYSLNPTNTCAGESVTFDVDIIEDTNATLGRTDQIVYYEWSFKDVNDTKLDIDLREGEVFENPIFTYETPGLYNVSLYVETEFGCSNLFEDQIIIHANPTSEFETTDTKGGATVDIVCSGESFFLDPDQVVFDLNGSTFLPRLEWDLGDGSPIQVFEPGSLDPTTATETYGEINHSYNVTDDATYKISLSIITTAGCSMVSEKTIRVFPEPDPSFTMEHDGSPVTQSCIGYPINLQSLQALGDESLYNYRWEINGSSLGFSPNGDTTVVFETDDLFDISLTVRRLTTDCEVTSPEQTLDVRDSPEAPAYGSSITFCSATGTLDAAFNSTDPLIPQLPGTIYRWLDAGDNLLAATQTYEVDAINGDRQNITLEIENITGCVTSLTMAVTLNGNLEIDLGPDVEECGSTTIGRNEFPGASYEWTRAGDPSFTSTDPIIEVTSSGTYTVTITDNVGACAGNSTTDDIVVTITTPPSVSLGVDREICEGELTTFSAGSHDSYLWSDGSTGSSLTVSTPGLYWVVVTDAGCSSAREEVLVTLRDEVLCNPACVGTVDASFRMEVVGSTINEVCVQSEVQFISAAAESDLTAYDFDWDFGDGTTSTEPFPSRSFSAVALLNVSLTVTSKIDGCDASSSDNLDVVASPEAPTYGSSITFCSAMGTLDAAFNGTDPLIPQLPGTIYRWLDESDNLLAATQTYEVDAINGDHQNITLEIENVTGCITSLTMAVTLNGNLEIDLGPDVEECGSATIGRNEFPSASYEWERLGDPSFTSTDPIIDVSISGTYRVTVTDNVGSCAGNSTFDDILVTINTPPSVSLGADREICEGELTTFSAGSHDSYLWSDGSTGPSLTVSTPGLYWVIVTDAGCSSAREEVLVTIRDEALCNPACVGTVDASFRMEVGGSIINEACVQSEVQFISAAAESDPTAYDFDWSFGDGSTSTEPFPARSFSAVSLLNVSLMVTSKIDGCDASSSDNLDVVASPEAPAYGSSITFCSATGTLDAAFNGTDPLIPQLPGTIYRWLDESDNLLAATQTYEVDAVNGDQQTIILEIENITGCITSLTMAVTLNGNLEIDLGPDVEECGSATIGRNEFPGASYEWERLGDPSFTSTDPIIEVTSSGTYTVRITDNVGACAGNTTFDDIVVTIDTPPLLSLGDDRQICSGELLTLNAGTHASYLWSDGSTGSSLTVSTSGEYWVQVTNASNCISRDTIVVEVRNDEVISPTGEITSCDPGCIGTIDASFEIQGISISNEVCAQTDLRFVSTASQIDPSRYDFFWVFGDGSISVEPTPLKQYDQIGSITVSLTVTSKIDGCTATSINNFTVLETPIIPIAESVSSCSSNITLDAENLGANYIWRDASTNDVLSTERLLELTSDSELPINIYLEVSTAADCMSSTNISVRLNTELEIDLGPDIVACESAIIGSNEFPSATYLWSTGETTPTIEVTRSGPYAVRVTEPDNDCVSEDVINVQIEGLPNPDLGEDLSLCIGEITTISPGNFTSYLWSDGSTQSTLSIGSPGTYWVEVSNDLGCNNRDSIVVEINETNPLNLDDETLLCSTGTLIDAGLETQSYQWGSSNGFQSSDRIISVSEAGMYWLEVEIENGCVHRDTTLVIESTDQLEPSFLIPSVVGVGDLVNIVQLTDPLPESSVWIFGDGFFSTETNPIHQYFETGEYTITLRIINGGCEASVSKTISVVESKFEQEQVTQELIEVLNLKTYPNPVTDKVNIEIEVSTEAPILVRIFTMNGLEVYRGSFEEKELNVPVDLSGQIAGLYLVNIEVGGESRLIKIVKPK